MSSNLIDDRDQSLTYIGPWSQGGTEPEYGSTSTSTAIAGSKAILTFSGISDISVWGTVASKDSSRVAPQTSYAIDNGMATVYKAKVTSKLQYRQLFFQKQNLSPDQHVLHITLLVNGSTFSLDYINLTSANTLPTTGGPYNPETTVTTTLFQTILLPDMSPEASTSSGMDQSASPTKSGASNTAAVVGSILGGLSLLTLIGALILWLVKKRRQHKTSIFRNQAMINLHSNPFKKKEPIRNPFDYEYGQPMSTENPKMFFNSFATDER